MCESIYYIRKKGISIPINSRNDLEKLSEASWKNRIRELNKTHKQNELHRFCRDIQSLVNAGYNPHEAYNFVKKRYKNEKQ